MNLVPMALPRPTVRMVFLLGAGAAHLGLAGASCLDAGGELLRGLVRGIGVHPKHELVERHHGKRSETTKSEH